MFLIERETCVTEWTLRTGMETDSSISRRCDGRVTSTGLPLMVSPILSRCPCDRFTMVAPVRRHISGIPWPRREYSAVNEAAPPSDSPTYTSDARSFKMPRVASTTDSVVVTPGLGKGNAKLGFTKTFESLLMNFLQ